MNGNTQRSDSSMTDNHTPARLEQRFEALESRLAYQEHWLDTLDRAVAAQERRLAQLERLNELMQHRLREQHQPLQGQNDRHSDDYPPENEIPPHY